MCATGQMVPYTQIVVANTCILNNTEWMTVSRNPVDWMTV